VNRTGIALALVVGIAVGALGYAVLDRLPRAPAPTAQPTRPPAAPAERALPEVPVSLTYVDAAPYGGRGYVVQFQNQSQKHLAVLVELENKTLGEKKTGSLQLAPGELVPMGEAQGWVFVSGEIVSVKLDGHRTRTLRIPYRLPAPSSLVPMLPRGSARLDRAGSRALTAHPNVGQASLREPSECFTLARVHVADVLDLPPHRVQAPLRHVRHPLH
jgi:hypothetical protein